MIPALRWLIFPGTNLHARLRWRLLPRFFGIAVPGQDRLVLDAGCGNGMLSYQSYLRGNRVIGISIKPEEVDRCRRLFNEHLRIPPERLSFREQDLYDVEQMGMAFDEIICSEVLEHIEDDAAVCRSFRNILKPGGILHLCAPNAEHPDNVRHELDHEESGGHVRPGYTMDAYRALLEPLGFQIVDSAGLGGPIRQAFNKRIIEGQRRFGPVFGSLLFLVALPFAWMDPLSPRLPYSVYVKAVAAGATGGKPG